MQNSAPKLSFGSIAKGIYSVLAFPVNAVGFVAAAAVSGAAKCLNIVEAFFTGKNSWFGRRLHMNPVFDALSKTADSVTGWFWGTIVHPAKTFFEQTSDVVNHDASTHSTLAETTAEHSTASNTKDEKRLEKIKAESSPKIVAQPISAEQIAKQNTISRTP